MSDTASTPALSLLVVRCTDLERSRGFYEALGLVLQPEQHGTGPRHFSTQLGGAVLEIYPSTATPITPIRFGLRLHSVDAVLDAAVAAGGALRRRDVAAHMAVMADPDGNVIELVEAGARPES